MIMFKFRSRKQIQHARLNRSNCLGLCLILIVLSIRHYGQNQDTLIDGRKFNYIEKFIPSGKVKVAGNYCSNKKHGFWIELDESGLIKEQGEYYKNKRVGKWWFNESEFIIYIMYPKCRTGIRQS